MARRMAAPVGRRWSPRSWVSDASVSIVLGVAPAPNWDSTSRPGDAGAFADDLVVDVLDAVGLARAVRRRSPGSCRPAGIAELEIRRNNGCDAARDAHRHAVRPRSPGSQDPDHRRLAPRCSSRSGCAAPSRRDGSVRSRWPGSCRSCATLTRFATRSTRRHASSPSVASMKRPDCRAQTAGASGPCAMDRCARPRRRPLRLVPARPGTKATRSSMSVSIDQQPCPATTCQRWVASRPAPAVRRRPSPHGRVGWSRRDDLVRQG